MKNAKKKTAPKRAAKPHEKTTYEKLGSALASTAAFLASAVSKNPEADARPRATDLLVHQHRKVEKLLERLESPNVDVDATLRELADDLTAHIAIEEKLFYPAIRKLDGDHILEGLEEHAMGRFALKRLLGTRAKDHALKARLNALKELMTNHHKEEENELFPKARKEMSTAALEKLGASMKKAFDADVKRGHEAVLATFDDDLRKPVRAKSDPAAKTKAKAKARTGAKAKAASA
jgi:iron-sulfur cluster repair protein YtfE (RIC family)